MVFNSFSFGLFFVLVLVVLPRLTLRPANAFLLVVSALFYAAWDWRFLGLIGFSIVVNYALGNHIAQAEVGRRRAWLALAIAINLGVLVFFKYYSFAAQNLQLVLALLGWDSTFPAFRIVLPLAISFYTFHCISYCVDIYRNQIRPADRVQDFALYVLLFPHLVAGPIVRASQLLPQIVQPRRTSARDWQEGLFLILWGLFKKLVVADNLASKADQLFARESASAAEVFLGVLAFTFQIYADFSGYTDMARGAAKLMGFHFDLNFRFPYLAVNPQDFWRRWHISLSQWLRDYVYIPLGGSRLGEARTYVNLMATMLLGGLWHGASWNFVLWGAYHGSLLCLHRGWSRVGARIPQAIFWPRPAGGGCSPPSSCSVSPCMVGCFSVPKALRRL
jgi:D-alanyl-lipoteichoic acid acyltransferase DltB (MBOAT superfamily)